MAHTLFDRYGEHSKIREQKWSPKWNHIGAYGLTPGFLPEARIPLLPELASARFHQVALTQESLLFLKFQRKNINAHRTPIPSALRNLRGGSTTETITQYRKFIQTLVIPILSSKNWRVSN